MTTKTKTKTTRPLTFIYIGTPNQGKTTLSNSLSNSRGMTGCILSDDAHVRAEDIEEAFNATLSVHGQTLSGKLTRLKVRASGMDSDTGKALRVAADISIFDTPGELTSMQLSSASCAREHQKVAGCDGIICVVNQSHIGRLVAAGAYLHQLGFHELSLEDRPPLVILITHQDEVEPKVLDLAGQGAKARCEVMEVLRRKAIAEHGPRVSAIFEGYPIARIFVSGIAPLSSGVGGPPCVIGALDPIIALTAMLQGRPARERPSAEDDELPIDLFPPGSTGLPPGVDIDPITAPLSVPRFQGVVIVAGLISVASLLVNLLFRWASHRGAL